MFVLGSTSEEKGTALAIAALRFGFDIDPGRDIVSCSVPSGVHAQPYGMREMYCGAANRMKGAHQYDPSRIAVGIENGIILAHGRYIDMAVIVLKTSEGKDFVGTSVGIEVPKDFVKIARLRGFGTTTVGDVVAEKMGGSKTDPHRTLTRGRLSRREILADALTALFCRIFSEGG